MTAPRLSIVIVSFNTRELLAACLQSIRRASTSVPYETIVVDNGSSDGSPDMVRRDFPEVRLLETGENLGFGAANNRGIRVSTGDVLLFLNSDTELRPRSLDPLLERLAAQPGVGIVGPTEEGTTGIPYPTICPDPDLWYLFLTHTGLRHRLHQNAWINPYWRIWQDAFTAKRPVTVGWVSGASLAVRRAVLERIGDFDEGYFMYMEEADLCRRARQAGWTVEYVPLGWVKHHGGGSSGKARGGLLTLSSAVSELRYFAKHRSPAERLGLRMLLFVEYAVLLSVTKRTDPRRWAFVEILRLTLGRREALIVRTDLHAV